MGLVIVRVTVLTLATAAGAALGSAHGLPGSRIGLAGLGLALGFLAVLLEWRARRVPVDRLFWGALGGILGMTFGLGLGSAVAAVVPSLAAVARGFLGLLLAYLGATVALAKRDELEGMSAKLFPRARGSGEANKILDTSVIIDGRIADICEAGFLEGTLVVPQFVLRELQQIADSPDGVKRNRGKRGFDVLERLQRLPGVAVRMHDLDFPRVSEVDRKLIELSRVVGGKIVTNDYNLNRVAGLSGVPVLNINELARALKPVALPGEAMRVQLVKEGKEASQGVGYLEDGTMVVVEQGRRLLGQTVDVTVTSVLQTSAGRMIFGRVRDEELAPR
jgi:uncharacterized protein YacL